jgi:hypothetical protein
MIVLSAGNATGTHDNGQSFTFNWLNQPTEYAAARAIALLQAQLPHENDTTAATYLLALNVAQQAANSGQVFAIPSVPLMHFISDDGTDTKLPFNPPLAVFVPPAASITRTVAATGSALDVMMGNAKAVAPTVDSTQLALEAIGNALQAIAAKLGVTL